MTSQSYRFVVTGRLSGRFADGFDNMTQHHDGRNTTLQGDLIDQAHVHGLLDQIRGLGIEVTSFEIADNKQRSEEDL